MKSSDIVNETPEEARIHDLEAQLKAAQLAIDGLTLELRLHRNGLSPNKPLIDDIERFRLIATDCSKREMSLVRKLSDRAKRIVKLQDDNQLLRDAYQGVVATRKVVDLKEIFVLMSDYDGTMRSQDEPVSFVLTEAEAVEWMKTKHGYSQSYKKLLLQK